VAHFSAEKTTKITECFFTVIGMILRNELQLATKMWCVWMMQMWLRIVEIGVNSILNFGGSLPSLARFPVSTHIAALMAV
jgi:hypothetical protein